MDAIQKFFSQLAASNSPGANGINTLFNQFLILCAIILLIVGGWILYSIIRYNAKKHPEEPAQIFGSRGLEITWTVLPFLAVTFFFVLTVNTMERIDKPVADNMKPDITVISHQWWWDYEYNKDRVRTANEMHIPVGKTILMRVEAADVIHDWWVQELGRKMDAIPGRINYLWIKADKPGVYEGVCSEYCGAEHAWMRILVSADSQDDYNKWVESQKHIPALPTDTLALHGAKLFQEKTCGNCHAIDGTPSKAHIAPDLTHLASRRTILSDMMPNNKENLRKWLKDPQKVKINAQMPNFLLNNDELSALVKYLEGLK